MRYQDIFVPGGLPKHTYNPRTELQLEEKLSEVKDNLCKLVTVTGQTKSGKTVLVRKILPPEETIWIDGGLVSTEDDFWQVIIENLELFQTIENEISSESGTTFGGKGTAEANLFVAKGTGEISAGLEKKRGSTVTTGRTVSSRVAALSGLRKSGTSIVVDDFHYIPRDIQGSIVRVLKPLIFDGLPVVIIAIPHRRYDALKVEKEMTGRISPIQIPSWTEEELAYIPNTGFRLLKYDTSDTFTKRIASESIGSPHLMQDFCRGICKAMNIEHSQIKQHIEIPRTIIESTMNDPAASCRVSKPKGYSPAASCGELSSSRMLPKL